MGLIVTFPHLDFFRSYFVTLVFSLVNLVLSLPLRRSLSTRMCSVTPSCHLVSHGLSRRNALRRCRSTKATPRVQVGQTSSRNITLSQDPFFAFLDLLSRFEPRTVLVQTHTRSLAMSQSLYYHASPQGSRIRPSRFRLGTLLHDATRGAMQCPRFTRTPEVESTYRVYHGVKVTQPREFVREQSPNLRLQAELPALSRLREHVNNTRELDSTMADLHSRADAVRSLRVEHERHSLSPNGEPSHRPPSPPPPPSFLLPPPAPLLQDEEELKGQEPIVFNGDRSKMEEFLTQWELYSGVNYAHSAMQMPFTKAMLFLTYIQGVQVNEWVAAQSTRLIGDVAHCGVPATTVALWTDLKDAFKRAFMDTLAQEQVQATLKRGLCMNGMDVDGYVATFKRLVRTANYDLDDPQTLDYFTDGMCHNLFKECYQNDDPITYDDWKASLLKRVRQQVHLEARQPQLSCSHTPSATPLLTDDEVSDHEQEQQEYPQEFDAEEQGHEQQGTQVQFSPKVEYAPPTTVEDGYDHEAPVPWAQHITKARSDLTDLRTRWNTMANTPSWAQYASHPDAMDTSARVRVRSSRAKKPRNQQQQQQRPTFTPVLPHLLPPRHAPMPPLTATIRSTSPRARADELLDQLQWDPALLAEVKRRGIGGPRPPSPRRSSTPEELSLPITLITKRRTVHKSALIDSGANQNLMDAGFARAHGLGVRRVRNVCHMYNIDGTLHGKSGTHYVDLEIVTNARTHVCRFLLMDLSDDLIVLGFPWLCKFEPQISWHNACFGPEYSDVRFKTIPPLPRSNAGQSSSAAQLPHLLRYPSPSDNLGSNTTSPPSTPPSSPRPRGCSLSRQPHLDGRASASVAHRTRKTSVTGDLPQVPPPQASSNAVIAPRKEGNVTFPPHMTSTSAIEKGKWLKWRDACNVPTGHLSDLDTRGCLSGSTTTKCVTS
jgi:hypothetical protein